MAVAVLILSFWLRIIHLEALGLGNVNNAATVQSMLVSGHNFFFVAAEPGGSITIEKPPLALWIQTLSVVVFGFRSLALFYPQIVSALLSTALVYRLVSRSLDRLTGLLAALILATTPISVALDRTNQVDSPMIMLLLLAAVAFLRAAESGSHRWLLAGGALIGLAFNTKQLQALIALPALIAVYMLESRLDWRRRITGLTGCLVVMSVVGLSWTTAVDMTPPDQRPYVGGSSTNSALDLALGFNGVTRFFGRDSPGPQFAWSDGQGFIDSPLTATKMPPVPNSETGLPGSLRLFTGPLNNDIGWLLPLGVLGQILLLNLARQSRSPAVWRQSILWGGWLLIGGVVLSAADFVHSHYAATLSPALAALAAIGIRELWQLYAEKPILGLAVTAAASIGLVVWQSGIALQYVWNAPWIPALAAPLLAIGLIGLAASMRWHHANAPIAYAGVVTAVLITPSLWAALTAFDDDPSGFLPRAYAGETCVGDICTPPSQFRSGASPQEMLSSASLEKSALDPALIAYLRAHTQDVEYLLAITDPRTGAEYVIATGRPVLYVKGFFDLDQIADQDDLARMVAERRLRFVLWPEVAPPGAPPDPILEWLTQHCQRVRDVDVPDLSVPPFHSGLYRCEPGG